MLLNRIMYFRHVKLHSATVADGTNRNEKGCGTPIFDTMCSNNGTLTAGLGSTRPLGLGVQVHPGYTGGNESQTDSLSRVCLLCSFVKVGLNLSNFCFARYTSIFTVVLDSRCGKKSHGISATPESLICLSLFMVKIRHILSNSCLKINFFKWPKYHELSDVYASSRM